MTRRFTTTVAIDDEQVVCEGAQFSSGVAIIVHPDAAEFAWSWIYATPAALVEAHPDIAWIDEPGETT